MISLVTSKRTSLAGSHQNSWLSACRLDHNRARAGPSCPCSAPSSPRWACCLPRASGEHGRNGVHRRERKRSQSKQPRPCFQLNWHQGKVPSAGTRACAHQAVIVGRGNPGCNRGCCHSGSERGAAFTGRLFWHRVRHTLQSITVKCLITDVVIKPEELRLYFLLQGITKCLIKPPIPLIFDLGLPMSSKMTSLQGLSS